MLNWRLLKWHILRVFHRFDFEWLLPWLAKLPLPMGSGLALLRGKLSAAMGRDWRSMALGFRHIRRQTLLGYRMIDVARSDRSLQALCKERFVVEARDEYEAQLVAAGRVDELRCEYNPPPTNSICNVRERGLLLLTPHFDSFFLGVGFLARSGGTVNLMTSKVTQDPRVDPSVQRHFEKKYRGLERYLNGGSLLDLEDGIRPFYRMLERNETLVVLADAPVLADGVSMEVNFLGKRRSLAGGALRMAHRTKSDLGGFVCRAIGAQRYEVILCTPGPADDPIVLNRIYQFFSQHILNEPGRWWAADMLPSMREVADVTEKVVAQSAS